MITALNKDLKPFEELVVRFSAGVLKPNIAEHDRYPFGKLAIDVIESAFKQIHELGFLGIMLPEKYSGIGQGISALCMMLGHIAEVDASFALMIFTSSLSQEIILEANADEIAMKIFPKAATAREYLIALPAFTDPGHAAELPRAMLSGSGYTLTGTLEYLVMGNLSHWAVIPARVDDKPGYTFFLVDLQDPGVKKGDPIFSLGLHACPIIDAEFNNVKAQIIGKEGEGEKYFDTASRKMHVATASISAGIMKGSFKEALDYTKERDQGGRKILNWSEVSMVLAQMAVKSRAAEMCVAQTCKAIEEKIQDWGIYSISSSLAVHEMACEVVTDGVQMLGGNGYMKDYGQEKRYRDARQVQALLGAAPLKKLALIKELSA